MSLEPAAAAPGDCAAVIVAAGSSTRMGPGPKKEYRLTRGQSVLALCLSAFSDHTLFRSIVVVVPPGGEAEARAALGTEPIFALGGRLVFADGGKSRRESVLNGLLALERDPPRIVLVHDAARPWVSERIVLRAIEKAGEFGASCPVVPTTDTLKEVDPCGLIIRHLPRSSVMSVQTPQAFLYADLLKAHLKAELDAARGAPEPTDDAEVWALYTGSVFSFPGEVANRKITFPEDLP
jgi:2-C-methyl-D-erythritol 4-phosphate cytidylyltransferase